MSSTDSAYPKLDRFRPELMIACGIAGLVGAILPIILNLVAWSIADHDIVADTISDLGRGDHKWIMDTGFYLNAGGLIALAIATAHAHLDGFRWSMGIFAMVGTALITVLLGLWDEFGGGDDLSIHTQLTFFLGPLYVAAPLLLAPGIRRVSDALYWAFLASAGMWLILATWFKLAPDAYDGIIERAAVLATLVWIVPLSVVVLRMGLGHRAAHPSPTTDMAGSIGLRETYD